MTASSSVAGSSRVAETQARKKLLRTKMRQLRRSLTPLQQREASLALYRRVVTSKAFRFARRIAFTIARDGEISPHLLLAEALRRGKRCYLPVMSKIGHARLSFRRVGAHQSALSARNRFNIPEPVHAPVCRPRALSMALFPLVAFDANCNRLGMGKGFYDHTFAFLHASNRQRPLLLGLAHECQRVEAVDVAHWDVPLQAIVTDQAWYKAPKIPTE
jgi:5-formyltetrahydrofolate cyclo-ligase